MNGLRNNHRNEALCLKLSIMNFTKMKVAQDMDPWAIEKKKKWGRMGLSLFSRHGDEFKAKRFL